jgi:hypothetical protein
VRIDSNDCCLTSPGPVGSARLPNRRNLYVSELIFNHFFTTDILKSSPDAETFQISPPILCALNILLDQEIPTESNSSHLGSFEQFPEFRVTSIPSYHSNF